jgi:hypothetical protein
MIYSQLPFPPPSSCDLRTCASSALVANNSQSSRNKQADLLYKTYMNADFVDGGDLRSVSTALFCIRRAWFGCCCCCWLSLVCRSRCDDVVFFAFEMMSVSKDPASSSLTSQPMHFVHYHMVRITLYAS